LLIPCPKGREGSYQSSRLLLLRRGSEKNVAAKPLSSFAVYLKTQNKRTIRQLLCYAMRYHAVIETGDASPLASISSPDIRRHTMEALAAYAKYKGHYEKCQQIRKSYSLHWTNGNESIASLQRFFDNSLTLDSMLQQIRQMIENTPRDKQNYPIWHSCWAPPFRNNRVSQVD